MKPWVQLYTGSRYYLDDMENSDFVPADLAALAHICRYAGACTDFYSVAEHSVLVMREALERHAARKKIMEPELYAQEHAIVRLQALIHDGPEIVIGDIPAPVKRLPALSELGVLEDRIWAAMAEELGLPISMAQSVKQADKAIWWYEAHHIVAPPREEWDLSAVEPPLSRVEIRFLDPHTARREYLGELTNAVRIWDEVRQQSDATHLRHRLSTTRT